MFAELSDCKPVNIKIKSDGVVYPVSLNTKTPFADMIFFNADTLFDINKETSCEDVIAEISKRLSSWSIFYAIRVTVYLKSKDQECTGSENRIPVF
ncbi:acetolactate decarboxylase [Candidatus Magnetomonas plexicatena]|uniref:acetolactate decarboxylase n=1 Tax=Candidatus Magnetomonas plexicatena TaxID=2552947 RepID=UPI001C7798A5|nr:acetolactate decarboxylase [Nitrospirales bacterium LBB_01]